MQRIRISYRRFYISLLLVYIICLPLNAINLGSWGAALKILAVLPVAIAVFGGERIKLKAPALLQMLFTVFALFSVAWTVNVDISVDRAISYVLLLALLVSGAAFRYTEEDIQKIKNALIWSSRLTVLVILIFARYYDGRLQLMGAIEEDPNYLCAYMAFGVVHGVEVLVSTDTLRKKVLHGLELLVYFYLVLVSGSRGGLLAVGAGAGVFLVTYRGGSLKQLFKKVLLMLLVLGVVFLVVQQLPDDLKDRFTIENVTESGGSGRTDLWKQAIDLYGQGSVFQQFFGYGIATVARCFRMYGYQRANVVHNIFLETLVELGILGVVIYTVAIFSFVKASYKFADKYAFSVILCMFVLSLSTSLYTFKPYFNTMLFIIILQNMQLNCGEKGTKQDDQRNNPGLQYRRIY